MIRIIRMGLMALITNEPAPKPVPPDPVEQALRELLGKPEPLPCSYEAYKRLMAFEHTIPHRSRGWMAWFRHLSAREAILHVAGQFIFDAPGYQVKLRRTDKIPDGLYEPNAFRLEAVILPPPAEPAPSAVPIIMSAEYREIVPFQFACVQIVSEEMTIPIWDIF